MKTKLLWLLIALATTAHAALPDSALAPALQPLAQQSQAAHMSAVVISRLHYKPPPLDDAMSHQILEHYLNVLDAEKFFFTKSDVDQLTAAYGNRLDDAIIAGDVSIPFALFKLQAQRVNDRFSYARSLLKTGFDFTQKESYAYARKKQPWLESEKEMNDLWRKRVKNDWLLLKLADQDDKAIVETLDKRYENSQKRIARVSSEDVFQAFMNAYTMAIDPHSNYLSPRAAEDFGISMSLSLFGIGASLSQKDDYTVVTNLIAGGPAALSGQLKAGDRIMAVGQGEGGALSEIIGWRLSDAVALIRGAVDSTVRLAVLPADAAADAQQKLVTLVRKKITLDDQSAKTKVLTVNEASASKEKETGKHGDRQASSGPVHRVGVITLPSFYRDFEGQQRGERDYRSATRDVALALAKLQREKVDAVLLDLRDNGGGSLIEAVETAALFIGSGPIVQQRDARGEIKVEHSARSGVAWDGPLGVLINRGSASASEIFAAAIQDYQRGVVIGEPSFGKGTVQALISLDELARRDKPLLGELKLTVGQFFRVTGGTTQRRGVQPDIALPTMALEDSGETSFDNALPWVKIRSLAYSPAGDLSRLLPVLERQHLERVKHSKDLRNLQENVDELKRLRERTVISLNENERRRERDTLAARVKSRQVPGDAGRNELADAAGGAKATAKTPGGGTMSGADSGNMARGSATSKDVETDFSLREAAHIVGDVAALLAPTTGIASSVKQASKYGRNTGTRLEEAARRAAAWTQSQRNDYGPSERP